jgi:hypothetical protein
MQAHLILRLGAAMVHSLRGMVFAIGFVAVATGYTVVNRAANYKPTKASIFVIDRTCKFNRQYGDGHVEIVSESCNSTEEFKSISKPDGSRKMDVDGKAVVKVSYTAPQDGSYQTSELHFDGRDDEFYRLKAGDEIAILVSNDDPAKIIKG